MKLSRSTLCMSPVHSVPHFHDHEIKFDAHFNNDKRLQQRLAKCRTEDIMITYTQFMPRLHKWMDSLGFRRHLTMPSRAFCSDETQGFPTVQMKRQFGVFPFDHGVVGGLLACDRHGPHSHHGEDMLVIQASHVGLDEETGNYGAVRRIKTEKGDLGATCGKLVGAIVPFIDDYNLCASTTLATVHDDGIVTIDVDTQFLETNRPLGTVLKYSKLFAQGYDGSFRPPMSVSSIRASFIASNDFAEHFIAILEKEYAGKEGAPIDGIGGASDDEERAAARARIPKGKPIPVGKALTPRYFKCVFNSDPSDDPHSIILGNLLPTLPAIVTHKYPPLAAAIANAQAEFETSYRSVSTNVNYKDRNFFYIAGINVDISPSSESARTHRSEFMQTRFIPWAAYYHTKDGRRCLIEQDEVAATLATFAEETREETKHREESLFKPEVAHYGS